MKALFYTFLALISLILISSITVHHSEAAAAVVGVRAVAGANHVWQHKPQMNHGSFRGPRKHLVDPTAAEEHPFEVPKLPV
ncbi:hypothetical protein AB3S75_012707 [Citrus x aurantiifolia]